jgi:hypothetical protein
MKETLVVMTLIISTITVVVLGTILAFLDNNISQLAYAQTNATSTTNNMTMAKSENITAPIAPQGTSINASDTTTP